MTQNTGIWLTKWLFLWLLLLFLGHFECFNLQSPSAPLKPFPWPWGWYFLWGLSVCLQAGLCENYQILRNWLERSYKLKEIPSSFIGDSQAISVNMVLSPFVLRPFTWSWQRTVLTKFANFNLIISTTTRNWGEVELTQVWAENSVEWKHICCAFLKIFSYNLNC